MGRHKTHHQKDHEDAIIEWISEGKTLRDYCRQDGHPHFTVVYDWLEADESFSLRFAKARDLGADMIAQECLEIADTPIEAKELKIDKDGCEEITIKEALGHRKLQIETRLKLLAKWNPKKYGDRIDHTSSDGSMSPAKDITGFSLVPLKKAE